MTTEALTVSPRAKCKLALKADAMAQALDNATPEQISNWVDNNVVTLADAKRLFKLILLYMKAN